MRVATVRVRDDYSPQGFKVINETDLNEFHERWPDELAPVPAPKHLLLGEVVTVDGVIGRGVVTIGEDGVVSIEKLADDGPDDPHYKTVADLEHEMQVSAIPADWQSMHWKQQVKLAMSLGHPGAPNQQEAKEYIAARVTVQ